MTQSRRFVLTLVVSVVVLIFGAVFSQYGIKESSSDYGVGMRTVPIDGMSYRDFGRLKSRVFRSVGVPDYGLFGLHVVDQFRGNMELEQLGGRVYNYFFLHMSVFEINMLLRHLDRSGALPRKGVLITLPNPVFGKYQYSRNRYEIPPGAYFQGLKTGEGAAHWLRQFQVLFSTAPNYIVSTLEAWTDWKNIIYGVGRLAYQSGDFCESPYSDPSASQFVRFWNMFCRNDSETFLETGTGARRYLKNENRPTRLRQDVYRSDHEYWNSKDPEVIAHELIDMISFLEKKDLLVRIIVPPVYMERDKQHINEVMVTKILDQVPNGYVIDDRDRNTSAEDFWPDAYHPSDKYWHQLQLKFENEL